MFCSNCGAKIDDSSRFCDMCGVPVEPVVAPPSENDAVPDEVRPVEISDASDDAASADASAVDAAAGAVTAAAASVDTTPAGAAPVDTTSAGAAAVDTTSAGAAAVDSATVAEPVYAAPEPAPGYGPVDTAPVYGQSAAGSDPYGYGQPDYSQPSYGQPSYQNYAAQPEVPYSGFAIAGLVTGILGFGIIALILSIMGKKECDEQGKRGRTMAVVGIVLSIITMVLSLIGTIIVFVFLFMAPRYL